MDWRKKENIYAKNVDNSEYIKGFKTWTDMARSLEDEAGANGAKIIWAGTNPDESSVFVMMDVPDPEFMQTFGLRPDIKKAREDA